MVALRLTLLALLALLMGLALLRLTSPKWA